MTDPTPIIEMTDEAIAHVVSRAKTAAEALAKTRLEERLRAVAVLIDYIRDHKDEVAAAICRETNKTLTDALVSEVMGVLDNFEWLVHKAPKILADKKVSTPLALMGQKSVIYHEPFGTVLVISPWNYPFHIGMTSIMAGFVAGNAVLFKPSEVTPLQGLFEKIFANAPLIAQSVFVCYGGGETAQKLIASRPGKIFFTGSERTGKRILAQAAELLIPVDLELGGKDPAIVFNDANLDRAVAGVMWGALTNAGQSCSSVERIYVQSGIYDEFVKRLSAAVNGLVLNYGDTGNADIGGITAPFQMDIIKKHVDDAKAQGATVHSGGGLLEADNKIFRPTVLTDVTNDMLLMREETFGPVLPVIQFDTEEEAIRLANDSPFGLSASVWGGDKAQIERVARAMQCGAVSVNNVMITEGNPNLPFGGAKNSGFGRQKGAEGLLGYARSKSVMYAPNSGKIEANWYPYTQKKYHLFQDLISALFSKGIGKYIGLIKSGTALESEAKKPRQ